MDRTQQLKELVISAKRALDDGTTKYEEANNLYQICKANCEKVEIAKQKFELIRSELQKQLQLINQLVSSVQSRNENLEQSLLQYQNIERNTANGIESIFQKLREKKIDPKLIENKTLYDFVDVDSIERIKIQASKEISELKIIQVGSLKIQSNIESKHSNVMKSYKDMIGGFTPSNTKEIEKTKIQISEINSISYVLVSLSTQYDRLNNMNHSNSSLLDFSVIEKRIENDMPALMTKINESFVKVKRISEEVLMKLQLFITLFKEASGILNSLGVFGMEVRSKLTELDSLELSYEQKSEEGKFLLEELSNLIAWYDMFYISYEELLKEILRRRQESRRQQELVEKIQLELNNSFQAEEYKRNQFYDFYGKYLPQTLCPQIYDKPNRYQILSEKQNEYLPTLSQTADPKDSGITNNPNKFSLSSYG